jgi:hypothetical protein
MTTDLLPARADDGLEVLEAELVDEPTAGQLVLPGAVDVNEELTSEAAEHLGKARPKRTSDTYDEQWTYFERWCAANGRDPGPRTTEANMVSYISHLARHGGRHGDGAAVSSLRLAMAAIRDANARDGFENWPPKKATAALIRAQAAEFAQANRKPKSSPPVDRTRVAHLARHTDDTTLSGLRDMVILHLGYHTRARRSEQANYRIDSVAFETLDDGREEMVAGKRTSKNDKWSTGKEYRVRDPRAIGYVRHYLAALAELGQADDDMPLLRGITNAGGLMPIPATGIGLTGSSVNRAFKRMRDRTPGFDAPTATSHGLRAGIPADLGAQGYSAPEIQVITGDWASTAMVEKYAKAGLRRAGKDTGGRAQAALDQLTIPEPPADSPTPRVGSGS